MKKYSLMELTSSLILLSLPALYGFWISSQLPDSLAVRFDFSGHVTSYMGKCLFLLLIPLIMLTVELVVFGASLVKPLLNKNFEHLIRWLLPVLNLILYPAVLYRNLHQDFPMTKLGLLIVGLLLVVFGNYLPKKVQADRRPLPRQLALGLVVVGLLFFGLGLLV